MALYTAHREQATIMHQTIRVTTTILPGGKIEIGNLHLQPGDSVDVVIVPRERPLSARCSAIDILAEAPGHRLFKDAAEVDVYRQAERDS